MTLIAAFRCPDGCVICADSQETVGDHRVSRQKITPKKLGNFEIAIGGSGNIGPLIDAIVHQVESKIEGSSIRTLPELKDLVRTELLDSRRNDARLYPRKYRDIRFVICARSLTAPALEVWHTSDSQLVPVEEYCLVGWDEELYEHAAKRLYQPGIPIARALLLGIYLLELAENTSNYVRGPTSALVARENGLWLLKADRGAALAERIRAFTAAVDRLVLACPDISTSEEEFAQKLKDFQETILELRTDYLQSIAKRMVLQDLESYQSPYPEIPPGTVLTVGPKHPMETKGAVAPLEPSHTCLAHFVGGDERGGFFSIRWIWASDLLQMDLPVVENVMFGVCGFSHRIFRLNYTAIDPLVFHDIVIRDRQCEEAKRCLARQCPLNKTTDATIRKLGVSEASKDTSKAKEMLKAVEKLTARRHCELFRDKPSEGGILLPSSGDTSGA